MVFTLGSKHIKTLGIRIGAGDATCLRLSEDRERIVGQGSNAAAERGRR
jgi:hypothetical protein